jgi:hypothetical protein
MYAMPNHPSLPIQKRYSNRWAVSGVMNSSGTLLLQQALSESSRIA